MIILGIDPGYAIVGYGAVRYENNKFLALDYGAITTPAGMPFEDRLAIIYEQMNAVILKCRPDAMSVEQLFFTNNKTTGIAVAEARGVILLSGVQNGVAIHEYTPMQVKQSVVGYGKAVKSQVIAMTQTLLNLKEAPKPDDTADALALAICHAHCSGSRLAEIYRSAGVKLPKTGFAVRK